MAYRSDPPHAAPLPSCEVTVTFDAMTTTWHIACGLPGPAGQARLTLAEGVILAVDRTDPQRALELSVELRDPDDPAGVPTAEAVELIEALFGTEAAKRSTTPADQAYGSLWQLRLDHESQNARSAACRLALLTEARDDAEEDASLWSAEAAWLASLVAPTMEPIVCAEAPLGASALRAVRDDVWQRLSPQVQQRLGSVASALRAVVGGDPLLDRLIRCSPALEWAHRLDADQPVSLATTLAGQPPTDAVDRPTLPGAHLMAGQPHKYSGGNAGRWIPLDPSAMSVPARLFDPHGMAAVWEPVARTFQLRAALLLGASAETLGEELWARAYHRDNGSLLAMQRARLDGDRLVADLLVPPDVDPTAVCVDLTTQPGLAPPPAHLRHYGEAIRVGRQAADLDRLGCWPESAARWADCARIWHCELEDSERAAMAFACAARALTKRADQLSGSDPTAAAAVRREARQMRRRATHLATAWAGAFVYDPGEAPAPFLAEAVQPLLSSWQKNGGNGGTS